MQFVNRFQKSAPESFSVSFWCFLNLMPFSSLFLAFIILLTTNL